MHGDNYLHIKHELDTREKKLKACLGNSYRTVQLGDNKQINQLSPIQQFDQLKKISKSLDQIIPIFMHTLEKIMLKGINNLSSTRKTELLNKWENIPNSVRMNSPPKSLQNLTASSFVRMSSFANALIKAAKIQTFTETIPSNLLPLGIDINALRNSYIVANVHSISNFAPMVPDGLIVRLGQELNLFTKNVQ